MIYSHSNFQVYNTILSTVVNMYISNWKFIHLIAECLYSLKNISLFPPPLSPGNYQCTLKMSSMFLDATYKWKHIGWLWRCWLHGSVLSERAGVECLEDSQHRQERGSPGTTRNKRWFPQETSNTAFYLLVHSQNKGLHPSKYQSWASLLLSMVPEAEKQVHTCQRWKARGLYKLDPRDCICHQAVRLPVTTHVFLRSWTLGSAMSVTAWYQLPWGSSWPSWDCALTAQLGAQVTWLCQESQRLGSALMGGARPTWAVVTPVWSSCSEWSWHTSDVCSVLPSPQLSWASEPQ